MSVVSMILRLTLLLCFAGVLAMAWPARGELKRLIARVSEATFLTFLFTSITPLFHMIETFWSQGRL